MTFPYGTSSIISFILVIGLIILTIILSNKKIGKEDTQEKCSDVLLNSFPAKDGQDCGIWTKDICRKGKFSLKDGTCVSTGSSDILLSVCASIILMVLTIVFLVLWFKNKA